METSAHALATFYLCVLSGGGCPIIAHHLTSVICLFCAYILHPKMLKQRDWVTQIPEGLLDDI